MISANKIGEHVYTIEYGGNFPSVNELYKIGRAAGGRSWLYKDPSVDQYEKFIKESLLNLKADVEFEAYKDKQVMCSVDLTFSFSQNFWMRDVSNLVKSTEDGIKKATGVDDRFSFSVNQTKLFNDVNVFEYLIVKIEVFELDEAAVSLSKVGG